MKLTPLKAIRKFCLCCVDGQRKEVQSCTAGNGNLECYHGLYMVNLKRLEKLFNIKRENR